MLRRDLSPPICYPGFWGDSLGGTRRLWSILQRDLQEAKRGAPGQQEDEDFLRYRDLREGLFSEFVGDFFLYLNDDRGRKIRRKLLHQIEDFLTSNPNELELHIISYSLGTVILWDMLFSRRLNEEPETQAFRKMLGLELPKSELPSVKLHSITTMGSPIVFANQMLDVRAEELEKALRSYSADSPLRWTNIIHPSDVLAYPVKSSIADLCQDRFSWEECLELRDRYTLSTSDWLAKAFGPDLEALWTTKEAHASYVAGREKSADTLHAIIHTLLGESMRERAIELLRRCYRITEDYNSENMKAAKTWAVFKDGSGSLQVFVNALKVYYVYVLNQHDMVVFGAYVLWVDSSETKAALAEIAKFADAA